MRKTRPRAMGFRQSIVGTLMGLLVAQPVLFAAQPAPATNQDGFVLGKVYRVDKDKYREHIAALQAANPEFDPAVDPIDTTRFLEEIPDVSVTGRQLATNQRFTSNFTNLSGEYMIRESPVGTYEFTLLREGTEYPVEQRLDLNVELAYVAELCFVLDEEDHMAWMVSAGTRRTAEMPAWVPRQCRSALSECLAMITGDTEPFPDGLLLLLAGAGAASTAIGIISTEQLEASSPEGPRN